MKLKGLLAVSALGAALFTALPSVAAPGHGASGPGYKPLYADVIEVGGGHHKGHKRAHKRHKKWHRREARRHDRHERRHYRQYRRHHDDYGGRRAYYRGHHHGHGHRWRRGHRFAWHDHDVIYDYDYYGLPHPGHGHHYVHVDGTFLLVAVATGIIVDILHH